MSFVGGNAPCVDDVPAGVLRAHPVVHVREHRGGRPAGLQRGAAEHVDTEVQSRRAEVLGRMRTTTASRWRCRTFTASVSSASGSMDPVTTTSGLPAAVAFSTRGSSSRTDPTASTTTTIASCRTAQSRLRMRDEPGVGPASGEPHGRGRRGEQPIVLLGRQHRRRRHGAACSPPRRTRTRGPRPRPVGGCSGRVAWRACSRRRRDRRSARRASVIASAPSTAAPMTNRQSMRPACHASLFPRRE